jgi:outer membrane protein TolC
MNRRAVLFVAFAVARSPAARAQPGAPASLSLRAAIAYARAHQPSIAAARARVEVALTAAEVPRAALAPRVTGAAELLVGTSNNTTTSYASLGALDVARIGGTPANAPASWRPEPSTLAGVAVHKELYDWGRLEAQADALDELARAAQDGEAAQELDLDLFVEESFYAVKGAAAVLAASDAAVTRAQAHHDLAAAKVGAQLWPPIELTRADADLARFQVDRVRAAGALATAQTVLSAAIGSDAEAIDAGDDDLAFDAAPASDVALQQADDRAPELRAARDRLRAQERVTDSIRDELRPDLSVTAGLTGRAGGAAVGTTPSPFGDGWLPSVPNWDALAVITVPLYDRTVTARARSSQRAESVRAAEVAELREDLRTRAARAHVELDLATATLPALERALDAASANHAQAEARFGGGLGTAIELSDAEALLTDAQIQLAIGRFQLSRARARLARALAEGAS